MEGTYVQNDNFDDMVKAAKARIRENKNPDRERYDLFTNNCGTFMQDILQAGGEDTPWMIDPRPNSCIGELQSAYGNRITYDPAHRGARSREAPGVLDRIKKLTDSWLE
ncbi:MAG: hypothetical protein ACJ73E_19035 [Mycobacteriales bacterium]